MGDASYPHPAAGFRRSPMLKQGQRNQTAPRQAPARPISSPVNILVHATAEYAWLSVLWLVLYVCCRARRGGWPSSLSAERDMSTFASALGCPPLAPPQPPFLWLTIIYGIWVSCCC